MPTLRGAPLCAVRSEALIRCQPYAPFAPKLVQHSRNQNEACQLFYHLVGSAHLAAMALVGLCKSRVYFCRLRLIKRNTGRRPVRLKWYKNQHQLRHSGATARFWPISSDATTQVYVAPRSGALANPPHEQPRRTKRYMWVSLAWPGVAVRPNASLIATARPSCSLNRR